MDNPRVYQYSLHFEIAGILPQGQWLKIRLVRSVPVQFV